MGSLKKRLGIPTILRREARGLLTLVPWVLVSLVVVALFRGADLAATAGLFQSSPPTEPTTPVPTATVEAASPTPTDTPIAAGTATEVPTATMIPAETPTPESALPSPSAIPTEPSATPTATPTATVVPPTMTPVPSATATLEEDRDRYSDGESELRFDWSMLFDSAALALTYVWLCCGVLVLVGIPVFFIVLWAAGRRRQQGEE